MKLKDIKYPNECGYYLIHPSMAITHHKLRKNVFVLFSKKKAFFVLI